MEAIKLSTEPKRKDGGKGELKPIQPPIALIILNGLNLHIHADSMNCGHFLVHLRS